MIDKTKQKTNLKSVLLSIAELLMPENRKNEGNAENTDAETNIY